MVTVQHFICRMFSRRLSRSLDFSMRIAFAQGAVYEETLNVEALSSMRILLNHSSSLRRYVASAIRFRHFVWKSNNLLCMFNCSSSSLLLLIHECIVILEYNLVGSDNTLITALR